MPNRLVLIDRDGTINVEKNYLSDPDQIEVYPEAAEAIKILRRLGLKIVVVTNQSGIGRGFFDITRLEEIHARLQEKLSAAGAEVDRIYYCPHTPEDACECRKPLGGMARLAALEFDARLEKSFVIGDNVCDIELGKTIGATTVLVRTGYGEKTATERKTQPDHTVKNLLEAAILIEGILENERSTLK